MFETIMIIAIILIAVLYLLRKFLGRNKGCGCGCGSGSCPTAKTGKIHDLGNDNEK